MNSKTTLILALLAAVAAVAVWGIMKSGTAERKPELTTVRLFPDANPENVTSITLSRSGALGTVVLTQSDGKWVLTAPVQTAADPYQAGDLARQLAQLSYGRAVPLTPATTAEYGLETPAATVKFTSMGKVHELIVGNDVGFGAQKFTYVMTPGSKEAYFIKGTLRTLATDEAVNFRAKTMIETGGGEVAGLSLTRGGGETLAAEKTATGWTITQPVRTRGDSAELSAVAAAAQGITAGTFVTDNLADLGQYGLDKPRLTVALVVNRPALAPVLSTSATKPAAELKTVTIKIGNYADLQKSRVYALVAGTPSVITLPEAKVRDLDKDLFTLRDKKVMAGEPGQIEKVALSLDGNAVTMERQGGEQWQITAPDKAPADGDEASSLLTHLDNIKVKEFVDKADLKDAKYGLETKYGTITYRVHGQTGEVAVTVGKNKSGELWVCEAGTTTVGRVDVGSVVDCKKTWLDLRDRTVFKLEKGQEISQISWTRSGDTVTIDQLSATGSETPWAMSSPVKAELDGDKVAKLVEALSNLNAKKWLANCDKTGDYGLDKPQVSLCVTVSGTSLPAIVLTIAEKNGKLVAMEGPLKSILPNIQIGPWLIFELDRSVVDLLDKPMWKGAWIEFDKDRVSHLEIAGPQLTVTFVKTGQEWASDQADLPANSMRVNWYLGDLAGLEPSRVVRYAAKNLAEFGLDKPAWRIRLKGLTVDKTLLVAEKGPTSADRYATLDGSGVVVVLDAQAVGRIVKDKSYFKGSE